MIQQKKRPPDPSCDTLSDIVLEHIKDSIAAKNKLLLQVDNILAVGNKIVTVIKSGGRVYSCGNGGSTCDAMHFTEELVARYLRERPGIPAQHLCDSSIITCWSNDYSFESIFERQVKTFVTSKDALVVFSTSGNSVNIVKAIDAANSIGALTVGILGKCGGVAKSKAATSIVVDSNVTARVQEAHSVIIHVLCEIIERNLPICTTI